jgi:hypothetical protein
MLAFHEKEVVVDDRVQDFACDMQHLILKQSGSFFDFRIIQNAVDRKLQKEENKIITGQPKDCPGVYPDMNPEMVIGQGHFVLWVFAHRQKRTLQWIIEYRMQGQ